MRFISVRTLLNIERGVMKRGRLTPQTKILEELDDARTSYAVLSHRWGKEVSYDEMVQLPKMVAEDRYEVRARAGYQKIVHSCKQAEKDGFDWLWVDTCCIDKRSSAELSEAINSMYRWYKNSKRCYAYLHDVEQAWFPTFRNTSKFHGSTGWPEWFSRGWTLQELIAPKDVRFFNKDWEHIGDKKGLATALNEITRVPEHILKNGIPPKRPSVAQIMSWAADRETTRVEDRAYSLLGLIGVHMPMLYGEGNHAFQRLQLEIIRMSNDQSIFAWDPHGRIHRSGSVLADDPSFFRDCHDIIKMDPDTFIQGRSPEGDVHTFTNEERFGTFPVTNRGIQIWLPLAPYREPRSVFKATLACRKIGVSTPLTIDLAFWKFNYYRFFGATGVPRSISEFRQLFLVYRDEMSREFTFKLDDGLISTAEFTRCGAFPLPDITSNSITLSSTVPIVVMVYANKDNSARFAVAFGYFCGQEWVHVISDDPPIDNEISSPWTVFAMKVYMQMRNAVPKHAHYMAGPRSTSHQFYAKHVHLPHSIWAVKLVYGEKEEYANSTVTIDIVQCAGCCHGPFQWTGLDGIEDGDDLPGLMVDGTTRSSAMHGHELLVDGISKEFLLAPPTQKIGLGDYGHWNGTAFQREGNIFEDVKSLSLKTDFNLVDPKVLHFVEHKISSARGTSTEGESVATLWSCLPGVVLQQPIGLSLANNQDVLCTLKVLFSVSDITNRYLVTQIIQCSACYPTNNFVRSIQAQTMQDGISEDESSNSHYFPTQSHNFTPLYTIARPMVWCPELPSEETRTRFKEIRRCFQILLRNQGGTHRNDEFKVALELFTDMFGVKHLTDYVGNITFFERLSTAQGVAGPNPMDQAKTKTAQGVSLETLADNLVQKMGICDGSRTWVFENLGGREIVPEAELLSKTLGNGLLAEIGAGYCKSAREILYSSPRMNEDDWGQSIQSFVQEVTMLEATHDATQDDNERRALEEDITGKILWTCWRGIALEIQRVIKNVTDRVQMVDHAALETRAHCLWDIGQVFKQTLSEPPDDGQAHLRRIMADAKADTSKYQLIRSAHRAGRGVGRETSEGSQ